MGTAYSSPASAKSCDTEPLCRADCTGFAVCGDGVLEFPEYCDDGNEIDDDDCNNDCEARCVTILHDAQSFDLCLPDTPGHAASPICRHLGSHRVVPATLEQDTWLREQTQALVPGPWWLGAVDIGFGGWSTENGSPLPVAPWAPGEPSEAGDCAALTPQGWVVASCDDAHPVICVR